MIPVTYVPIQLRAAFGKYTNRFTRLQKEAPVCEWASLGDPVHLFDYLDQNHLQVLVRSQILLVHNEGTKNLWE